jgi:hypothetical protein
MRPRVAPAVPVLAGCRHLLPAEGERSILARSRRVSAKRHQAAYSTRHSRMPLEWPARSWASILRAVVSTGVNVVLLNLSFSVP